MAESVYRVTEVVGVSSESWEAAARVAVETAAKSVRELRVAEVVRQDVTIQDGGILNYRVRLGSRSSTRRESNPEAGSGGAAAKARSEMADAWVYLLRCRDGSLYTGWTVDVERRLARHRAGTASRYTASRLPVALELALPMPDRTAARREEARIKRLSTPRSSRWCRYRHDRDRGPTRQRRGHCGVAPAAASHRPRSPQRRHRPDARDASLRGDLRRA